MRGGFGIFYGRAFGVDTNGATGVGIGPLATPPHFLAPIVLNANISSLSASSLVFTPQTTVGGPLSYKPPSTYDWSFGIQNDLGKGFVLDISYVGNVAHHQFNQGLINANAIPPLTDWTPTANNGSPGPSKQVTRIQQAPTAVRAEFYSTNLLYADWARTYPGWAAIQQYSQNGESNYNALQAQFNKRVGKNFHFGSNYSWSKTLVYSRLQWDSDKLNYNVAGVNNTTGGGTRPQAVNINFGYAIPGATKYWNNKFVDLATTAGTSKVF